MVILIMGVSGCGKTTVGREVAGALDLPFVDADDLHSRENISKMNRGVPLTDRDRLPWLKNLAKKMSEMAEKEGGVVACSALKECYREILLGDKSFPVMLVYLRGEKELLYQRLLKRKGHFMPADLLESQLRTLEEPADSVILSAELPPGALCKRIVSAFEILS